MQVEVKWKSDKHCLECRKKVRQETIKEVKEACKGCKKVDNVGGEVVETNR
jgi:hypothetical protein